MFTKLEQRSWLKLKQEGQNSKKVTEDWKRLAVRQHYRIGQLQGGFNPSAVDRSVRTINKTGAAKGITRLPHRWERVLHNFVEYIEGLWKYELCRCAVSKVTAALPQIKIPTLVKVSRVHFRVSDKYVYPLNKCVNKCSVGLQCGKGARNWTLQLRDFPSYVSSLDCGYEFWSPETWRCVVR